MNFSRDGAVFGQPALRAPATMGHTMVDGPVKRGAVGTGHISDETGRSARVCGVSELSARTLRQLN